MKKRQTISDATYIELFRVLCSARLPTVIIGVVFSFIAYTISLSTHDRFIQIIFVLGTVICSLRALLMFLYLPALALDTDNIAAVKLTERYFAAGSFAFAAMLGALGARTFSIGSQPMQMLIVTLVFGYTAGLITRGFSRPWICMPSLVLAALPPILAAMSRYNVMYITLGLLMSMFLFGSIESMRYVYDIFVTQIALQQKFALLARNDDLTGLFNRLALREGFEVVMRESQIGKLVAVHYLDLDQFKPVNDRYGHQVGDALLKMISQRLAKMLRKDDFAARVGGDEFIVVQTGIDHTLQAENLAHRIVQAIIAPYDINGQEITIGTSVGIAVAANDEVELDMLIAAADAALYEIKRQGGGSVLLSGTFHG